MPLELVEGATTGLLVAATILYAAKLAPRSSQATLQGVIATVHYGVGECRATVHYGVGECRATVHYGVGERRATVHYGVGECRATVHY